MISNVLTPQIIQNEQLKNAENTVAGDFLAVTSRFTKSSTNSWISLTPEEQNNVYTGIVQEEIDKVLKEDEQINKLMQETKIETESHLIVTGSLMSGTAPETEETALYALTGSQKLSAKTDTTSIKKCIVGDATQKKVLNDAIDIMVNWLDDLIANYDTKIAAGKAAGHQEVKLTMLLQLRNIIKNCDFPIGVKESTMGEDVGGVYSHASFTKDFDNVEFEGQQIDYYRRAYDHHLQRSIMFPPSQIYPGAEFITAATLIHELTHSMHISNECVTYLMEEVFGDDMGADLAYGKEGKVLKTDKDVVDFGNWWEQTSQERNNPSYVTDKVGNKKEFDNFSIYS